jgi:hypothetical protein
VATSIFLDFTLPNSTSWFYFSLFLTVSLFFNFHRPFLSRNWDLLALFLFVPGFLFVQESHVLEAVTPGRLPPASTSVEEPTALKIDREDTIRNRTSFLGYLWLIAASGYWLIRCLVDLSTTKRPLPSVNLAVPALMFFTLSLFVCLAVVAFQRPGDPWEPSSHRATADSPDPATSQQQSPTSLEPWTAGAKSTHPRQPSVVKWIALLGHCCILIGLYMMGSWRFQDRQTGAMAAALYLLLPYTAYHISMVSHVWPAVFVVWALLLYRNPGSAGGLLGLAIASFIFPVVLVPAWIQFYRGRSAGRFLLGLAVGIVVGSALMLALACFTPLKPWFWSQEQLANWQPWQVPQTESLWTGTHWAYRLPVFIAYLALVVTTIFWPPIRDLGNLVAISAALIIGLQFWQGNQGGLYVLWYVPLLIVMVVRPNLTEHHPPMVAIWPRRVVAAADWCRRRVAGPSLPA